MKLWMLAANAVVLSLATGCYPAVAQKNRVTCTGILSELDMNPHADFPMAVVYDNTDSPYYHTCVLDLGHAGHWPLKGACSPGQRCIVSGPYFKKIGNTYYMREWDKAEDPDHPQSK
jgi:hypothetical protein